MKHLSKDQISNSLRKGKASELVLGGVWYYKDRSGEFNRVVNENIDDSFRSFCKRCSEMGFLYLYRSKPNYSYTKQVHEFDHERIIKYQDK